MGMFFWNYETYSVYSSPLEHFLGSVKCPGVWLMEETALFYVFIIPMYRIRNIPEDYVCVVPKARFHDFPYLNKSLQSSQYTPPSLLTTQRFKEKMAEYPAIDLRNITSEHPAYHMTKRTLLSLRRTYIKTANDLKSKPKAYFWNWVSAHVGDQITKDPRIGVYGIANLAVLNNEVIPSIMKRISKIFGEEFVYVGNGFMHSGMKSLVFPKSICKSYTTASSDEDWLHQDDWARLKDMETIVWDPYNKLWCIQDARRIILGMDSAGVKFSTIAAYTTRVKSETQDCPSCGGKWFKQWITRYENNNWCPDCITKAKAPNVPHNIQTIYQGYHSSVKNGWKFRVQRSGDEDSMPMGVELEVHSRSLRDTESAEYTKLRCGAIQQYRSWKIYEHQKEHNKEWHNLIFERDGSLGDGGVEIISNPMTLEYGSDFWGKMLPFISKQCIGWGTEEFVGNSHDYGIHITVHRDFWTDYRIGRMVKFMHNPDNTSFLLATAQRATLYGGGDIGTFNSSLKKHITYKNKGKLGGSIQRYSLANVKSNFIEFRMFRSTLNIESFMKNLELIDGLYRWIHAAPYSNNYMDFIKWLVSTPDNRKRYTHLIHYLDRPKFNVKKLRVPIINSWKPLLTQYTKGQKALFEDLAVTTTDIPEEPPCV